MFPSLQPSRPKLPQQPSQPTYLHEQRRATHEVQHSQTQPHQQPTYSPPNPSKPLSQMEAMPPAQTTPFFPPQSFYDAATRHPVFFTNNLKKPPFPIPQIPSQGWSPVANGYVQEREKTRTGQATKL